MKIQLGQERRPMEQRPQVSQKLLASDGHACPRREEGVDMGLALG